MVMTLVILALCVALPVLGVAHIAEQRRRGRAEREAIESERRFRQLAESSFDMIVLPVYYSWSFGTAAARAKRSPSLPVKQFASNQVKNCRPRTTANK